jgi:folate-dependent phosphoribosylglycinamide formyltransferase PurN
MRVCLFTANSPRHLALAEKLSTVADSVHVIQECATVFPGRVEDYYRKSPVMQDYFGRVIDAEREVFGTPRFLPANVRQLALRMEDLSLAPLEMLSPALEADIIIVFGASYIKGPLVEAIIERGAVNIHMGISPYYRGSSCNFWALYDDNPDLVGATIHMISKGLDSGEMLYHVRPKQEAVDPFVLGMKAVEAAQDSLVNRIANGELNRSPRVRQDKASEIRYTRNSAFTDEVAAEYLARDRDAAWVGRQLQSAPERDLLGLYQPT